MTGTDTAALDYPVDAFAKSAGFASWTDAVRALEAGASVRGSLTTLETRSGPSMVRVKMLVEAITALQQALPDVRVLSDEYAGTWTLQRQVHCEK